MAMFDGSDMQSDASVIEMCCNGSAISSDDVQPDNEFLPDKLADILSTHQPETADAQLVVENDVHVAAQLGKVLLQQNEELQRKNKQIIEEFCEKIEVTACEFGRFSWHLFVVIPHLSCFCHWYIWCIALGHAS